MISFAEVIKGRDSHVRLIDDLIYAVDLIVVATGNSRKISEEVCNLKL
jgi:hypothetical protein